MNEPTEEALVTAVTNCRNWTAIRAKVLPKDPKPEPTPVDPGTLFLRHVDQVLCHLDRHLRRVPVTHHRVKEGPGPVLFVGGERRHLLLDLGAAGGFVQGEVSGDHFPCQLGVPLNGCGGGTVSFYGAGADAVLFGKAFGGVSLRHFVGSFALHGPRFGPALLRPVVPTAPEDPELVRRQVEEERCP